MHSFKNISYENGIKLTLDHSFGSYQIPIQKNAVFVDEDTFIYISGKHLVEHDLIRKK
jgi:hypothetical protein